MKLNCLVIEDSAVQRMIVVKLVNNNPQLHLVGDFSNAIEARNCLNIHSIDLIFLDIEMPVINGFSFLEGLKTKPQIIFVTAKAEHALRAFDYAPTDYIKNPNRDHSPDVFSYSILENNGSFIFNKSDINSILKDNYDNFKINAIIENGNLKFICYDGKGNKYYFGTTDESREYNAKTVISGSGSSINSSYSPETTGWLIDKIEYQNGKILNFEYQEYEYEYTLYQNSQTISEGNFLNQQILNTNECEYLTGEGINNGERNFVSDYISTINRPNNKIISKIYSNNVSIEFKYSENINASVWKMQLDEVLVKNTINSEVLHKVIFDYGYFSGDSRLKLNRVLRLDSQDNQSNIYEFNYNEDHDLPSLDSKSRDYFGYQNGKNNLSLIPLSEYNYSRFPSFFRKRLANLEPDLQKCQNGTLKSIIYPTGGKKEFFYALNREPNENGNHVYVKDSLVLNTNNLIPYNTSNGKNYYKLFFQFIISLILNI